MANLGLLRGKMRWDWKTMEKGSVQVIVMARSWKNGGTTQLNLLLKLCEETDEEVKGCEKVSNCSDDLDICMEEDCYFGEEEVEERFCCPICGIDISELSDELVRQPANEVVPPNVATACQCPGQVLDRSRRQSPKKIIDVSPVLEWLRNLGLAKYEEVFSFLREEIDWDTLKWLTEEDLCSIDVTALGPRKKIFNALSELKKDGSVPVGSHPDIQNVVADESNKLGTNKLTTNYF